MIGSNRITLSHYDFAGSTATVSTNLSTNPQTAMTQSAISPGLPSPSSPGITIKELKLKPTLPFEIQRRIIHFRLALTPSYPSQLEASAPITPAWDDQAGQIGRQAVARRMIERGETQDAALDLMRVCKAWKVGSGHPVIQFLQEMPPDTLQ